MPKRLYLRCGDCGRAWEPRLYAYLCPECAAAEVAPRIELLKAVRDMDPIEAYVRGILAEKVRAHDRASISALGAILDRMRQPTDAH